MKNPKEHNGVVAGIDGAASRSSGLLMEAPLAAFDFFLSRDFLAELAVSVMLVLACVAVLKSNQAKLVLVSRLAWLECHVSTSPKFSGSDRKTGGARASTGLSQDAY